MIKNNRTFTMAFILLNTVLSCSAMRNENIQRVGEDIPKTWEKQEDAKKRWVRGFYTTNTITLPQQCRTCAVPYVTFAIVPELANNFCFDTTGRYVKIETHANPEYQMHHQFPCTLPICDTRLDLFGSSENVPGNLTFPRKAPEHVITINRPMPKNSKRLISWSYDSFDEIMSYMRDSEEQEIDCYLRTDRNPLIIHAFGSIHGKYKTLQDIDLRKLPVTYCFEPRKLNYLANDYTQSSDEKIEKAIVLMNPTNKNFDRECLVIFGVNSFEPICELGDFDKNRGDYAIVNQQGTCVAFFNAKKGTVTLFTLKDRDLTCIPISALQHENFTDVLFKTQN